jgi:NADH-quinone oxidoreductase subunit J
LLQIGVEFLIFIILLVYIGAVAVVFLFVLLLLRLKGSKVISCAFIESFLLSLCLIRVTWFFYWFNLAMLQKATLGFGYQALVIEDTTVFASLYSDQCYYFLLSGMILLFSMVGAISLCTNFTVKGGFWYSYYKYEYL